MELKREEREREQEKRGKERREGGMVMQRD